jgi:hypothetical protein
MQKELLGKLVYVDWVDTVASAGWDTHEDVNIKRVKEVGWLLHKDNVCVKISSTFSEDEYYSITAIPLGCVVSIREIEIDSSQV